jgi:hypothetical protein
MTFNAKLGNVLRRMRSNWALPLTYVSAFMMVWGHTWVGLSLWLIVIGKIAGKSILRWLAFCPPVWFIRWHMRPVWRRLHWMFGRKWYWVHHNGIAKVVVTERDPVRVLWAAMEYRPDFDKRMRLNRFSSPSSLFFDNMQDAVKELVHIHNQRYILMEEHLTDKIHALKGNQVGYYRYTPAPDFTNKEGIIFGEIEVDYGK